MRALAALFLAALLVLPAAGAPDAAMVVTLPVPEGRRVEAAAFGDVDGDGRMDLVVADSEKGREYRRTLRIHLRREGRSAFAPEPDRILPLTPDVVAFAPGDVEADPGDEILLFTAGGVFALRTAAKEDERPRKVAAADLLWQLPHPREAFVNRAGVRDLDGDGLADLVLPEPGGYRAAFQRRPAGGPSEFTLATSSVLPEAAGEEYARGSGRLRAETSRREFRLSLAMSSDDESSGELMVAESLPCPVFADFDADGLLDLLALHGGDLLVYRQRRGAGFPAAPDVREPFPLTVDRGRRLDLSFASLAGDLDGDGRADCVVVAGDRRSEDPRTQVLVYRQGAGRGGAATTPEAPLFGPRGVPGQLLLIGGFAGSPDLADVDGDGRPDLVIGRVKLDAVGALRAASSGSIEAELFVYRNRAGEFSVNPDLAETAGVPTEGIRGGGGARIGARFIADVDGDGLMELLHRYDAEHVRVLPVRPSGRGLSVGDAPLLDLTVNDRADVLVGPGAPPELLVVSGDQVLHVRFR